MKYKQMINKKCTVCLVAIYLLVFNADMWFVKVFCPSFNYINV